MALRRSRPALAAILLLALTPAIARPQPAEVLPSEAELRQLETTFAPRLDELAGILREGNDLDRGAALDELARIGLAALRKLTELARDERWEVRRSVASALGRIGSSPVVPTLITLLKDGNWSVREAAADALAGFRDAAGRDALIALLDDRVWRVKVAALFALAARADAAALPRILALSRGDDEDVRWGALEALTRFDHPEAAARLAELRTDPDPAARRLAVLGVERAPKHGDAQALLPLLRDPEPEVAIPALGVVAARLGPDRPEVKQAIAALVARIAGPVDEASFAAATLLEELSPRILPQLRGFVRHPDPAVRTRILDLLRRRNDAGAGPELVAAYDAAPEEQRRELLGVIVALDPARMEFFLRVARAGSTPERTLAIRELGRRGSTPPPGPPEDCEARLGVLGDPEPAVRQAAARALRVLGSDLPAEALLARLHAEAEPAARVALLELLDGASDPAVTSALRALYDTLPDRDRPPFADAIGRRADPEAEAWLRDRLADPDPEIRIRMVAVAGRRLPAFTDALLAVAQSDSDTRVRLTALNVLSGPNPQGGPRDDRVLVLLAAAARDPEREIQDAAISALAARPDPSVLPILLEAAATGEEGTRLRAIDALAHCDDPRVPPALLAIVAEVEAPETLRSRALLALTRRTTPAVVEGLLPLVATETSLFVKLNLAYALAFSGDPRATEALARLAGDAEAAVRATAASCLAVLPGTPPLEPLAKACTDPDPGVRRSAVEALAARAAAETRGLLFARLADPDSGVRRAARQAVGRMGEAAADQAVLQAVLQERELAAFTGEERWFRAGELLQRDLLTSPARRAFESVLATPPEGSPFDGAARFQAGLAGLELGRFAESAEQLDAALAAWPTIAPLVGIPEAQARVWGHVARGLAALAERKETIARREFAEAERGSGGNPGVLNAIAWYTVDHGLSPELALEFGGKALTAQPGNPAIQDTVGWIHYRLGHPREALELLGRACASAPDEPDLAFHRARVLMSQGQRGEAFEHLSRAVMRAPGLGPRAAEAPEFRAVRESEEFRRIIRPGPRFAVPE